MIRQLNSDEVGLCVPGAEHFFEEGKIPGGFEADVFIKSWHGFISSNHGAIHASFEGDTITGALGALLCPNMNSSKLIAVECFWFVFPQYRGHGIRLLLEFEQWSKSHGASMVAMIHLTQLQPEKLKTLYERMGYKEVEVHYVKEI